MAKITIRDVAQAAGVSVSTVSQVFNSYPGISKATKERVFSVAQELGYTPNIAARNLSVKKKRTIALVLNEINVTPGVARPLELLTGVSETLDATDYDFVFYATNRKKQVQKSLQQFFNEQNLAGLIIQGLATDEPYYKELATLDLPVVAIDLSIDNPRLGQVSIDNEAASQEVTRRLIDAGYERLVFLNGSKNAAVSKSREKGFQSVAPKDAQVFYANFSENEAFEWAVKFDKWDTVDAVFAASDLMAIGVLKGLKEIGCQKMPAIVGFDDVTLARYVTPTLTTVRQDAWEIARQATENLIQQIETGEVKREKLDYQLIIRESAII
ncbi:MAG: LacI family transcriptional regulator [Streptococcaceae bacterium]|jgi:LacI family transcriptional regulator|nr:LacI family transcriptional regulator [Streptococcaceae bacterium]